MLYEQTLEYLHSLGRFGIKPGLERMTAALKELGDPHQKIRSVHVAGTNGKGSTVAMIDAILRAKGFRAGRFTSPHLSDYCERIVINGLPIGQNELAAKVTELQPLIARISSGSWGPMTEFEVSTLLALQWFFEQKVDYAVIEVGLGGRLDSTNVIEPLVSVITPVDMDHMDRLGTTLSAIAGEKAGIIKQGIPVVTAGQHADARQVIEDRSNAMAAHEFRFGRDYSVRNVRVGIGGTFLDICGIHRSFPSLRLNLLGRHQAQNAAVAVAACETLAGEAGFVLDEQTIREGLDRVEWPGRFEMMKRTPPLVLDGAHNPHGVAALNRVLADVFPERKIRMVIGILDNRPVEEMVSELARNASYIYATAAVYPGSADPDRIQSAAWEAGVPSRAVSGAWNAVQQAMQDCSPDEALCCCGSLYMIGEVRPFLCGNKDGAKK